MMLVLPSIFGPGTIQAPSNWRSSVRSLVGGQGAERAPLAAECSATLKVEQGMQCPKKQGLPVAVA